MITATINNVKVLELTERKSKDGNKVYRTIIGYVDGQTYPALTKVDVPDDQLKVALGIVGHVCDIIAEVRTFSDRTSFIFLSASPVRAKAAA
jgi:hypothetical protein